MGGAGQRAAAVHRQRLPRHRHAASAPRCPGLLRPGTVPVQRPHPQRQRPLPELTPRDPHPQPNASARRRGNERGDRGATAQPGGPSRNPHRKLGVPRFQLQPESRNRRGGGSPGRGTGERKPRPGSPERTSAGLASWGPMGAAHVPLPSTVDCWRLITVGQPQLPGGGPPGGCFWSIPEGPHFDMPTRPRHTGTAPPPGQIPTPRIGRPKVGLEQHQPCGRPGAAGGLVLGARPATGGCPRPATRDQPTRAA